MQEKGCVVLINKINPYGHTKAIGAYSATVSVNIGKGKLIFISGQVASDQNGITIGKTITEQTEFVFEKIVSLLRENECDLHSLISITIYITDMEQFEEFNIVRNRYLEVIRPASTLVEVSALAIKEHLVEISGVAYIE
jgi:enamine deaminase RidA (YjgF/YER057c/UK114 family)